MAEITISLPEDQLGQLRRLSELYGVTPEALARFGIEDMLTGRDAELEQHIDRILQKNRSLYERLSG